MSAIGACSAYFSWCAIVGIRFQHMHAECRGGASIFTLASTGIWTVLSYGNFCFGRPGGHFFSRFCCSLMCGKHLEPQCWEATCCFLSSVQLGGFVPSVAPDFGGYLIDLYHRPIYSGLSILFTKKSTRTMILVVIHQSVFFISCFTFDNQFFCSHRRRNIETRR